MKSNSMMFKILGGALILALLLGLTAVATDTEEDDPLVTLGYLVSTFKPALLADVETLVTSGVEDMALQLEQQVAGLAEAMESKETTIVTNDYAKKIITEGQSVSVDVGNEILWLSGAGNVNATCMTDTTAGTALLAGDALTTNHLYVATGAGTITATADGSYLIK